MPSILLVAINAKYIHSALGARCLQANLGPLLKESDLVEFDIRKRPSEMVEEILGRHPRILALGVYIWNLEIVTEVVLRVKALAPDMVLLLGGPEVSFPSDLPPVAQAAHYLLCGEGEVTFPRLCQQILSGRAPESKVIPSILPDLPSLELPYDLYQEGDILNRILYIESSRGCPFGCQFCLSSLDKEVRYFDRQKLFSALEKLLARGVKQFKFTDRTFNLNISYACEILQFFLDRMRVGLFLHFEMVPHILPEALKQLLVLFPPATLQLEIGIQTLNPEVARRISRSLHLQDAEREIRWLRQHTNVHLHTDLIGGLPGEDLQSFAQGFDTLFSWNPQEIQLGILKRLRGAPLAQHTEAWGMVYSPVPPYEVLKTNHVSYPEMCDLKRVARFWDLLQNSGRFPHATPLIWEGTPSPFGSFMECSRWLFEQLHQQSEIALPRLARALELFLVQVRHLPEEFVHQTIEEDLNLSHHASQHSHSTRQERRRSTT